MIARHRWRTTVGVLVGVVVLITSGWAFGVKPAEVARHLRAVPTWAIGVCALSSWLVLALQALRRHLLMRPQIDLRYRHALAGQVLGAAFNVFLPMRGGDLVRVEYLARISGESRPTILGTEILDRWVHCWGWFAPLVLLSATGALPSSLSRTTAAVAVGLGAWAVAMALVARRRGARVTGSRALAAIESFREGLAKCSKSRIAVIALLVAPISWLCEAWAISVAGRAFGIELSYPFAFTVLVGFNLTAIIPSPGDVGSLEAGGVAALVLLGVERSAAMAFMLVYHAMQLVPTIAAGLAIVIGLRVRGDSTNAAALRFEPPS